MDPWGELASRTAPGLPRTRGDGPSARPGRPRQPRASPHTRGWTRTCSWMMLIARRGFPAHAGMDPPSSRGATPRSWLPRTRGDGPPRLPRPDPASAGFPAHAGMDPHFSGPGRPAVGLPRTRGDGPLGDDGVAVAAQASPHTRGWTRFGRSIRRVPKGFPAHAGMDPRRAAKPSCSSGLPRTRGDGPAS